MSEKINVTKWLLGLSLLGGLGYLIARKVGIKTKSIEHFRYSIVSVTPINKGKGTSWWQVIASFVAENLMSLQLAVKLRIINPNKVSVPLIGFNGKVLYKGKEIGYFNNVSNVRINGNFTTEVDLLVTLNNISLIETIISVIKAGSKSIILTVDGIMNTSYFDQTFSLDYTMALPELNFLKKKKNETQNQDNNETTSPTDSPANTEAIPHVV